MINAYRYISVAVANWEHLVFNINISITDIGILSEFKLSVVTLRFPSCFMMALKSLHAINSNNRDNRLPTSVSHQSH